MEGGAVMASRDRRRPLAMPAFLRANPDLVYYRDQDGAARPKLPQRPPAEPAAVLRYLLEVDHLGRGKDGSTYNPRISLDTDSRALIKAAITAATGETI